MNPGRVQGLALAIGHTEQALYFGLVQPLWFRRCAFLLKCLYSKAYVMSARLFVYFWLTNLVVQAMAKKR